MSLLKYNKIWENGININTLEPEKVTDIFEWFFRKFKNVFDSKFFP